MEVNPGGIRKRFRRESPLFASFLTDSSAAQKELSVLEHTVHKMRLNTFKQFKSKWVEILLLQQQERYSNDSSN